MMRMSLQPPALLKIFLPFCKFRLHTAIHGAEISATCQMQHKLGRFPLQHVTADIQHRTPTSTYLITMNTSHGNRDTGMNISVQITNIPKVPTTSKFIYPSNVVAKVSGLLGSAAVLFHK
jgi:hypothetical protein